MKLLNYFFISVLMLSLAGCSLFESEEDVITVAATPNVKNEFAIKQLWSDTGSLSNDSDIYSLLAPVHYKGVIYAANRAGKVKAINQLTGKTLWNIDLSNTKLFNGENALISGGVNVDENYVYVASERAIVYALNRTSGKLVWEKQTKGEVLSRPVSSGIRLFIYTTNGYLQALNKKTGKALWDTQLRVPTLTLRGNSTPKISNGVVIVGDTNGRVNAFSIYDGQLIWQQRIAMPLGSSEIAKLNNVITTPIVERGLVYAASYNGNVAAFSLTEGKIIWKQELSVTHNFALNNSRLFIVDQHDNILAMAKKDGKTFWKQTDLLNRQLTDPVLYQNYIVVGDFEGYLYWLNASNGKIVVKQEVSRSGILATPLVVGNRLIVQAKNGDVYAFTKK